ncbi:MAG: hypothetical protein EZS28_017549, partial [Streblomastix strix]
QQIMMKNLNSEEVIIDDDKQVDINEVCKKIQKSKVDEQVKLVEEQKQKEEIDDMLFKEEKQQEIIQQLQKLQEIQEMQQKFQQKKRKTNQSLYIKDINEIGNNEIDELQQEQITAVLEDSQQQQDEDEQNRRIILNELNRRKMNRKQSSFINLSPSPSSNQLIMSPPQLQLVQRQSVQISPSRNSLLMRQGSKQKISRSSSRLLLGHSDSRGLFQQQQLQSPQPSPPSANNLTRSGNQQTSPNLQVVYQEAEIEAAAENAGENRLTDENSDTFIKFIYLGIVTNQLS